jgi:hypothetical protein
VLAKCVRGNVHVVDKTVISSGVLHEVAAALSTTLNSCRLFFLKIATWRNYVMELSIVQLRTISRTSRFDDVAKSARFGRGVQIPLDCQRPTGTNSGYRTRLRPNWTGAKPTGASHVPIKPGYDLTGLGRNLLGFPCSYQTRLRPNWTGAKPTGLPMFLSNPVTT